MWGEILEREAEHLGILPCLDSSQLLRRHTKVVHNGSKPSFKSVDGANEILQTWMLVLKMEREER